VSATREWRREYVGLSAAELYRRADELQAMIAHPVNAGRLAWQAEQSARLAALRAEMFYRWRDVTRAA
jgi:hypothetical protein